MDTQEPTAVANPPVAQADDEDERRIQQIVDRYLVQLEAGESPDKASLLAACPNLAGALERRLTLVETVFRAGRAAQAGPQPGEQAQRAVEPAGEPGAQAGSSSATPRGAGAAGVPPQPPTVAGTDPIEPSELRREFALHIKCPHCGNQIQLVQPVAEVTCRNCGSTFQLDSGATAPFREAEHPDTIGKFEILEVVGRGGFGIVYKAHDAELDRVVALKVPRRGYFATAEEEGRFLREARHCARLKHPHIVQVHEIGYERGVPYIVSDFIEGLTLADRMTGSMLSFRESAELVANIADAFDYAHGEKIVHRDIKPSNILIDRTGQPYVTDFGLARRDEGEITVTLDGQVLGTPAYMPPEQAAGDHHKVDARSDVYSLGVILYRLISGELPFRGNKRMLLDQVMRDDPRPPSQLNDRVPRDLETVCLKAMAKEPARRYGSARALADDLRRWLSGEPIRARPVGRAERLWRWCRRNPTVAALTAAVAALLLAVAIGASVSAWRERGLRSQAQRARELEATERQRAEQNAAESRRRLARLYSARGVQLMDDGDLFGSLVWFTESLALEEPARESVCRIRLGSVLRHCPKLVQMWVHQKYVGHAQFSHDGNHVLTASGDGTARVWDTRTGQAVTAPLVHGGAIPHAAFSPDGRRVVTTGTDHTAQIWNVQTGERVALMQHADWVTHASFSPDGRLVATASDDDTARIWDADTGKPAATLKHEKHVIRALFSPDGRRLLTVSGTDVGLPGFVRLWDTRTWETAGDPLEHSDVVWDASFSPDGTRIVTASEDQTARVWDAETAAVIAVFNHDAAVRMASFNPDGRDVVTASDDETARIWDAETGRPICPPLRHRARVHHAEFAPGGGRVLTASADGTAQVWSTLSGIPTTARLIHGEAVLSGSFSPDGRQVATASADGTAKVWDLASPGMRTATLPHEGIVWRADFARDGERVATASADGTARVWDARTGKPVVVIKHDAAVIDATFSPDGRRVATACWDGAARVWDMQTGDMRLPPLRHAAGVQSVQFTNDGRRVVTASEDNTAKVWDAANGNLLGTLEHGARVFYAAFSADGDRVITASKDRTARVWDAQTGRPLTDPLNHADWVRWAAFSPRGDRVATASKDHTAMLWDAASGKMIHKLEGHTGPVWMVDFSSDGRRVVTASLDGSARVWDPDTGQATIPPIRQEGLDVVCATFSGDGELLLTASERIAFAPTRWRNRDGMARVWDVATGEPLMPPLDHRGRVRFAAFSPDATRIATVSYDHTAALWQVAADNRPVEDLRQFAQLLSGHRLDEAGGFVPLAADAMQKTWDALRSKYPESFVRSSADVLLWQQLQAAEQEQPEAVKPDATHPDLENRAE
jgi:WD40 repeat protein/ribosomal protein S27E